MVKINKKETAQNSVSSN